MEKNPAGIQSDNRLLQRLRREKVNDPEWNASRHLEAARHKYMSEYAGIKLASVIKEKVHVQVYEEEDYSDCRFEPFDMIVQGEGGRHNPENVLAAKKICKATFAKGKSTGGGTARATG